jgi:hypothetical protein
MLEPADQDTSVANMRICSSEASPRPELEVASVFSEIISDEKLNVLLSSFLGVAIH